MRLQPQRNLDIDQLTNTEECIRRAFRRSLSSDALITKGKIGMSISVDLDQGIGMADAPSLHQEDAEKKDAEAAAPGVSKDEAMALFEHPVRSFQSKVVRR